MDLLGILLSCYLFLFSLVSNVEGMHHLTASEDLEIERHLKMLNKSPVKTVKTKGGEIIDCVDIYKQPTLDHPLLKNHKIQMRPTKLPKMLLGMTKSTPQNAHATTMSGIVNCPQGTVPIRRTQREDLIRAKAFSKSFSPNIRPLTNLTPGRHQAIVRSKYKKENTYFGIGARMSIYNPAVGTNQTSTSQIWMERGPPSTRTSLQVGWMVAPDLYRDNNTHLFSYWSVQGDTPQGCFNQLCQGFVHLDSYYMPGKILGTSSEDFQYHIELLIFQDILTGNWWLRVPTFGRHGYNIGYWPKDLFPQLQNGASTVVWGGQAFGQRYGASPGMGKGVALNKSDFDSFSFIDNMKVVDPYYAAFPPLGPKYETEIFVDNTDCYKLEKYEYNGDNHKCSFLFGGPGGSNCGA